MSKQNVAIVRAMFEGGDAASKEAMLAALPDAIPALFHPDAEWIEAPERVDAKSYRGHDGIRESFEHWLEQWDEYRIEVERIEDHDDQVLVVAREHARGQGSGAPTEATIYTVFDFRDDKVSRYCEYYDEATARASLVE